MKSLQHYDFEQLFADANPELPHEDLVGLLDWIIVDPTANELRATVIDNLAVNAVITKDLTNELRKFEDLGPSRFVSSLDNSEIRELLKSSAFLRGAQDIVADRLLGNWPVDLNDVSTWHQPVEPSTPKIAASSKAAAPAEFKITQTHIDEMKRLAFWFCGDQHLADEVVAQVLEDLAVGKVVIDGHRNPRAYLNGRLRFKFLQWRSEQFRGPVIAALVDAEGYNIDVECYRDPSFIETVNKLCNSALEILEEEERQIIKLYYLDRLPDSQIAVLLGSTQPTINRKRRGTLEKMKKFLIGKGVEQCPTR